ncbi:MAG: hypothetical protein M1821_008956 [Bathelium mastoideum]|nr:MAG: hypothetical protein M1821_008956 [Bathelium mastoideum]
MTVTADVGKNPLRLAILECDPLIEPIRAKYGSYGGVVTAFFNAGAEVLGLEKEQLDFTSWDVQNDTRYPNLDQIDAIVITGSRLSAFDDVPWITALADFTKKALSKEHVRIIGLCFGHQIIGRALGMVGETNSLGYEMSVCSVDLTPPGQHLFGQTELAIHQMHHDIITSYPTNVLPLGSSAVCSTQGMLIPRKLITLQGHPEFNGEIMLQLLNASDELGFEDKALWEDAVRRAKEPHDGALIAATFLRFLQGGFDEQWLKMS